MTDRPDRLVRGASLALFLVAIFNLGLRFGDQAVLAQSGGLVAAAAAWIRFGAEPAARTRVAKTLAGATIIVSGALAVGLVAVTATR